MYGVASGWQFVDDADAQIAIYGHRQGAGNGGGCHHQYVRSPDILVPELGPLCHAESVLFVHDAESEISKLHIIFQ